VEWIPWQKCSGSISFGFLEIFWSLDSNLSFFALFNRFYSKGTKFVCPLIGLFCLLDYGLSELRDWNYNLLSFDPMEFR